MKTRAVIVDDELNAIRTLEILIATHCPELEVIATASSVGDAVNTISSLKPDLVFLDIEMPTGSGFEVIERLKGQKFKLIFTTAYEQYAHKAFKVEAIDYLLKPIDREELKNAVAKVGTADSVNLSINELTKLLTANHNTDNKIAIPTNEGFTIVNAEEIVRVESDSNYSWFILNGDRRLLVSKTLKEAEVQLEKFGFIRVHNSHLINQNQIEKYVKTEGGYLVLKDGTEIPISKRKRLEVLRLFE